MQGFTFPDCEQTGEALRFLTQAINQGMRSHPSYVPLTGILQLCMYTIWQTVTGPSSFQRMIVVEDNTISHEPAHKSPRSCTIPLSLIGNAAKFTVNEAIASHEQKTVFH